MKMDNATEEESIIYGDFNMQQILRGGSKAERREDDLLFNGDNHHRR